MSEKPSGTYGGKKVDDGAVLEAFCTQNMPEVTEPGESVTWVQLDVKETMNVSAIDDMPLINPFFQSSKHYVNSAFVVGEEALPLCDQPI
ncbi:MAG: hypothetical protein ABIQ64_01425 [Candidatus Saccharimonadales bacterium]